MNMTEALSSWLDYRREMVNLKLVAASTFHNQRAITDGLTKVLGHHALAGLRKSHIELWMGKRLQTCAPLTVRGELNVLRQVLRWCVDEGHLAVPPRLPKLAVPNTESALPSDEAFLWVLAHVPPQHAAALEFMMLTGLSPHELERVQVRDAGAAPGALYMRGHSEPVDVLHIGQREDFAVKQPSRRRAVPLNGRARDLWFEAAAGAIATTLHPWPKVDAMQKAIRRAMNGADEYPRGTELITPKIMRKWFASKVAGEQPEHVLQRLLGHAPGSPITRRHYVRSSDEQAAGAVAGVALAG